MGRSGTGKKRLRRLAEWHFHGGDAGQQYCRWTCQAESQGRCEPDPETGEGGCPYLQHEPETDEGEAVWEVIIACGSQLRVGGMGTPFALDYGAVMMVGQARSVDTGLLAEVLPDAERAILAAHHDDDAADPEE